MTVVLLAVAAALPVPAANAQEGPRSPVQWIDVHVHPAGDGDFESAVNAALDAMTDGNMAKLVLMPTPQGNNPHGYTWTMEDFLPYVRRHPHRLAVMGGGGSLNLMIHKESPDGRVSDELKARFRKRAEEILAKGAVGFGEMSILHISLVPNHAFESVRGDHPLLLLLADIAAEHHVPIDMHMDLVVHDIKAADWLSQPPNPPVFKRNIDGFERLLEHNPKAIIVWAHVGSDNLGQWTSRLTRKMLRKHPNLYMSLRLSIGRGGFRKNNPLSPGGIKPNWLAVFREFPDRFVIGSDEFFISPKTRGPKAVFAKHDAIIRKRTKLFLSRLPPDLARKIGYENAIRIYKLKR